jgi:hypothetical protein
VTYAAPPENAACYRLTFMDFMVQQCRWAKDICAMEDGDQPQQQCLGAKLPKAYASFCDFFNVQW